MQYTTLFQHRIVYYTLFARDGITEYHILAHFGSLLHYTAMFLPMSYYAINGLKRPATASWDVDGFGGFCPDAELRLHAVSAFFVWGCDHLLMEGTNKTSHCVIIRFALWLLVGVIRISLVDRVDGAKTVVVAIGPRLGGIGVEARICVGNRGFLG